MVAALRLAKRRRYLTICEDCAQKLRNTEGIHHHAGKGPAVDRLDRRILREVQQNCSLTATELGERCGTTESTALRRLNRLRREGVIRAEVAIVDGDKIGRGLLLFVGVRLEGEDSRSAKAFVDKIMSHRDVMQFYFVTGTPDYMIMLSVRSMEDYDVFVQEHLVDDPHVVVADTNVVIRPLKMSFALPMDDPVVEQRHTMNGRRTS